MSDEKWYAAHRLFHYTKDVATVASILRHGFLMVPNRRGVIERLLPGDDFGVREPQQFGMASFTELPLHEAQSHREEFGDFGIGVTWEWAFRNGAHRVIYVDEVGVVFEGFKWLFELARQELDASDSPAIANKAMAMAVGAPLYHAMLTLYEYMETSRNSSQVEWRIVNKLPIYHDLSNRSALMEKLKANSKVSSMGVVAVTPNDIEMIVCPQGQRKELRAVLAADCRAIPILPFTFGASLASRTVAAFEWVAELRRKRHQQGAIPIKQATDSIVIQPLPGQDVFGLPPAHTIKGVMLHPNAVKSRSFVTMQYENEKEQWFEMRLTTDQALRLLGLLRQMEADPRFGRTR